MYLENMQNPHRKTLTNMEIEPANLLSVKYMHMIPGFLIGLKNLLA